jgi:hypothetical protein
VSNKLELPKQQYQRTIELCQLARQRYLAAGGDPKKSSGTLHNNDCLTEEERQEFLSLVRQLAEGSSKSQNQSATSL